MTRDGMSREAVASDIRRRFFGSVRGREGAASSLGMEAELLPVSIADGSMLPIEGAGLTTATILRAAAKEAGWREDRSGGGAPSFHLRDGARLSFEPGGQLEYSSAVHGSAETLLTAWRCAHAVLRRHAEVGGAALLAVGIDPLRELEETRLLLDSERYTRMDAYLSSIGPFGARMMRQTAALQINIAAGGDPLERWRLLGAAAPVLLALFANSRRYAGRDTGHASYRAHVWRRTDESRTGLPALGDEPVEEYADFALDAAAMLCPGTDGSWMSARTLLERGVLTSAAWESHCSTMFPEVRPKGYFELRSLDALEEDAAAAALVLVGGLALHPVATREARALLPTPDGELLRLAGERGIAEARLCTLAADLAEIGLRGAAALGEGWVAPERLERAREHIVERLRAVRGGAPGAETTPGSAAATGVSRGTVGDLRAAS